MLPAQQLSEIISHVRDLESRSGGKDQRRTARMDFRCPLHIRPVVVPAGGQPSSFTVLARDISQSGLGLLSARPMTIGESFVVLLPRGGRDVLIVVGEVAFARQEAEGMYAVGLQFTRVVPVDAPPGHG